MLHADHTYHSNPLLALTGDGVLRGGGDGGEPGVLARVGEVRELRIEVENLDRETSLEQNLLHLASEGRFSRTGKSGEPKREAFHCCFSAMSASACILEPGRRAD